MWGTIIAAAGALIGQLVAKGERDAARKELEKFRAMYGDVALPDLEKVIAEQVKKSEAGEVAADPQFREAKMSALGALKDVRDAGGLTLADRAALNKLNNQAARHESAGRAAIKEDMSARGTLGSGNELAMRMDNNQASAQRSSEAAMDTAGMAQKRALDAMIAGGRMAGEFEGQDYDQRFRAAQARDAMEQWNAARRTDANMYNARLPQQNFQNQLAKLEGQTGLTTNIAKMQQDQAQNDQNMWSGFGQAGNEMYKTTRKPRTQLPADAARWSDSELDRYLQSQDKAYGYGD